MLYDPAYCTCIFIILYYIKVINYNYNIYVIHDYLNYIFIFKIYLFYGSSKLNIINIQ